VESAGGPFEIGPAQLGEVRADEVRVRMTASGICHTDLLIREGTFPTPMPVVLGHEGAGVVEEVGAAVAGVAVGDRVAMSYGSCGDCRSCATGRPFYCAEFFPRNFLAARADGKLPPAPQCRRITPKLIITKERHRNVDPAHCCITRDIYA